jgi:NAD(P)-dependent dehydrogenase (short-subunit alcohol dehydrogenase family)
MNMSMNIERKIIVITGVTKGLGRALAARFIELGYVIAGCGRSKNLIAELQKQYGSEHYFDNTNVINAEQIKLWALRIIDTLGVPSILINNAAMINRNAPLWEISDKEFSKIIDINIKGVANTIRAFSPLMIRHKQGIIVNLSSTWGRSTAPEVAPYCATKWGIEGLTKALAQELPLGMAAVVVNPGVINTDMLRSCMPDHAHNCQTPEKWAERAAPFIINLTSNDNGKSLSV